jgi:anaerobic ribonucleoside-triphosphate reductase activating protein
MTDILLNIAAICPRSKVNGPDRRAVVWVQGCSKRCPGCFNPQTHTHRIVRLVDPDQLGRDLLTLPDTDGLTFSGGEPFEQAAACARLAGVVRDGGQNVMVFTGHTLEDLRRSEVSAVHEFLSQIDLLVAGPFVRELKTDGRGWLASSNQKLHFLTERLRDAAKSVSETEPTVELVTNGSKLIITGFPETEDLNWLAGINGNEHG